MVGVKDARFIATFVLPGITFFFGILSMLFPTRQRYPLLISLLLCFGAGVLLATSMLHMLPEAHESLADFAELAFCVGFLAIYLIDEVIYFLSSCDSSVVDQEHTLSRSFRYPASILPTSFENRSEKREDRLYDQNSFDSSSSNIVSEDTVLQHGNRLNGNHPRRFSDGNLSSEPQDTKSSTYAKLLHEDYGPSSSYGSISTSKRNTVNDERGIVASHENDTLQEQSNSKAIATSSKQLNVIDSATYDNIPAPQMNQDTIVTPSQHVNQEQNETPDTDTLCHSNYFSSSSVSRTGRTALFLALTFHATLEGVAVGLEDTAEQVMLLTGAIICHKLVVAFCFGLELMDSGMECLNVCCKIFLFSLGSLVGVTLGALFAEAEHIHKIGGPIVPILQAIAAGSLLYVILIEILPRERAKWHYHTEQRAAGIFQFTFVATGFCVMYAVNTYIGVFEIGK